MFGIRLFGYIGIRYDCDKNHYQMSLNARKPDFVVCDQKSSRPASASMQFNQHLLYLLSEKNDTLTCEISRF